MRRFLQKTFEAWMDYPEREGTLLGGVYEIERLLGEGSYGITYLCRDVRSGMKYAIKQARPSKRDVGIRMLEQEAKVLRSVRHANIPQLEGHIQFGNKHLLILEYIEGLTVDQLIFDKGCIFREREVLEWILRLLEIVEHIHEKGFVHLDIRIPNVIVQGEKLALIDFGLARRIGDKEVEPRRSGENSQWRKADVTSDLYAIGHFMLFMLYSSYPAQPERIEHRSSLGWEAELRLTPRVRLILRKLLGMNLPYKDARQFEADLQEALQSV